MGIRLSSQLLRRQALSFLSTYSFADDIRKAFSGEESRSTAVKAVEGAMDEITKLWDAAFVATAKSEGQGKADSPIRAEASGRRSVEERSFSAPIIILCN